MKAGEACAKAAEMVGGDRERQHGNKLLNFERIAVLWNAWLKIRRNPNSALTVEDVGQMLSLLKKARTQGGEFNSDDYVDDIGYVACLTEIAHVLKARIVPLHKPSDMAPGGDWPKAASECAPCRHRTVLPNAEPCQSCIDECGNYRNWELVR